MHGSIWIAIYLGFAAAMLGISRFENSVNFVEEQQDGVFPKTFPIICGLWSAFLIPYCLFGSGDIPIPEVSDHANALFSYMGETT